MDSTTENPVLEKIRKLLAKAEGTDNEAEANTFFSKAQELMEKYAIDEALARQAPGQKHSFKIVQTQIILPDDTIQVTRSKGQLLHAIAKCNRCTMYYWHADINAYRTCMIVGTEADINFVNMLFHSILIQMDNELLKGFQAEMKAPTPPPTQNPGEFDFLAEAAQIDKDALRSFTKRSYRPEFIDGYCERVSMRIEDAARNRDSDRNSDSNSMALVVLRDNKQAIDDFLESSGVRLKPTRSLTRYNNNSYARGQGANAANRADLGNSKLSSNRKELT